MTTQSARHFVRDARGSVTIVSAAGLLMMIGFTAIAVDLSTYYFLKRKQQAATDLAALSAAYDIARATQTASTNLLRNGVSASDLSQIETGVYQSDPSRSPDARFQAGPENANAVRVSVVTSAKLLFARALAPVFGGTIASVGGGSTTTGGAAGAEPGAIKVRTSAVATRSPTAAFAIGSRLAALDGGIENAILGAWLGTKLSLSVMDYEALAAARIDMLQFSDALATRLSLSGVTYDTLLTTRVRMSDLLGASLDVLRAGASSTTAINALQAILLASTSSTALDLTSIIDFGPYGPRTLGALKSSGPQAFLLDLVTALAQKQNAGNLIRLDLAPALPGLLGARLQLAIGERPAGTVFMRLDRLGTSVHTAQTRLLLSVDLIGTGAASAIELPLYVEIAPSTARLAAISCNGAGDTDASVSLGVKTGLVDGWIGAVSDTEFKDFTRAPNPKVAKLVNLPLLSVTGRAHANVSNLSEASVRFSSADIAARLKKTTSTKDFVAPLLEDLVKDLQLTVTPLGLGLPIPGVSSLVTQTIAGSTSAVDTLLNRTLSTLGIGLGQADSWVTGVRCGGSVLVN